MANFPGPYEIEFEVIGYTAPVRTHKIRLSVVNVGTPTPGDPATSIILQKKGGATTTLQAAADLAWGFLRPFFSTTLNCPSFSFWRYVPGTRGKDFITSGTITNPAGTGGTTVAAHEIVMSFRSANGGILKTVLLETINTGSAQTALIPNSAGNIAQKWAAYVLSADSVVFCADDAYPIAALRVSDGENERIWRKLFRPS
jgi:hypothetical protein